VKKNTYKKESRKQKNDEENKTPIKRELGRKKGSLEERKTTKNGKWD